MYCLLPAVLAHPSDGYPPLAQSLSSKLSISDVDLKDKRVLIR